MSSQPPFWVMYLFGFMVFLDWSIVVPTIIGYLESMGDSESEAARHFAWAQTGFALAQFTVSMLAGPILFRVGSFCPCLLVCAWLLVLGNGLYALADPSAADSPTLLITGRVLAGLGAGGTAVGAAYMSVMCENDRESYVAKFGRYRTAGSVATVGGPFFAFAFTYVDISIGGFHVHAPTMPGIFTAVCFLLLSLCIALFIRGRADAGGQRAYRCNMQIGLLLLLLFVSAGIASTMIYIMPVIMTTLYAWGDQGQSSTFTAAAVAALLGSCLGQEKRLIHFHGPTRSFDARWLLNSTILSLVLGVVLVYLGAVLADGTAQKVFFLLGCTVTWFSYSLINNTATTVLTLIFTAAEKVGMTPFSQTVIAFSKIITPVLSDAALQLRRPPSAGWSLLLGLWAALAFLLLLALIAKASVLVQTSVCDQAATTQPSGVSDELRVSLQHKSQASELPHRSA